MYQVNFIARVIESRNDKTWNYGKNVKFSKEIKVEFLPTHGMIIKAYDMDFEVHSVADLESGKVVFTAEGKKSFVWHPSMKEPTLANQQIKKLQEAGFSKEKDF
jgi:hypothetical protein